MYHVSSVKFEIDDVGNREGEGAMVVREATSLVRYFVICTNLRSDLFAAKGIVAPTLVQLCMPLTDTFSQPAMII